MKNEISVLGIDDFLNEEEFRIIDEYIKFSGCLKFDLFGTIREVGLYPELNKYYKEVESYQFAHMFTEYECVENFIQALNVDKKDIIKLKVNMTPPLKEKTCGGWHYDHLLEGPEFYTCVLYLDSIGGTIFSNGDEIGSIRNRLVIFKGNMLHSGINHTCHGMRVVLNFNFYTNGKNGIDYLLENLENYNVCFKS